MLTNIDELSRFLVFLKEKRPEIPKEYQEWVKEKEEKKLPGEAGRVKK